MKTNPTRLRTAASIVTILAGLATANAASPDRETTGSARRPVLYNLDCSEFFVGTFGPVVPATIDKFVDSHARAGVSHLLINVNAQRVNYRSKVWDAAWDGLDPKGDDNQPFFAGIDPKRRFETAFFRRHWKLHADGCNYPARMIQAARRKKIDAWISIRMNDAHRPAANHPYHSTIWKSHPEWRLSNQGLDYERPEVREHHLKLVREVCQQFDLDGLELDFLRFWLYFRPGREHEGGKLMNRFIEQARAATRAAEQRLKHPVKLSVRVPSTPWIARRHGLDAVAWARAGLVDHITAGSFWASTNSDIPVETWKGQLIGTDVAVSVHLEDGISSGSTRRRTMTHEEMRGILSSALHRGADAVYFFNLFTGPYQRWSRKDHDSLLTDAGSLVALQAGPRRHAVTLVSPWSEGAAGPYRHLPYKGRHGKFRLHIGPRPRPGQQVHIELLVAGATKPLDVRINSAACAESGMVEPAHIKASGWKGEGLEPRRQFRVPHKALVPGYNLVEIRSTEDVTVDWVEISVPGLK
jgi:hypothetical protein